MKVRDLCILCLAIPILGYILYYFHSVTISGPTSYIPVEGSRHATVDIPLFEMNPRGNQPPNLQAELAYYGSEKARSSFATMQNAYWHFLNLRNGQPFGGYGSTGDYQTQWQMYFWRTNQMWLKKDDMKICELGMGPGYSSIVFLTATANKSWKDGPTLYQFDLKDGFYRERKALGIDYLERVFGDRIFFVWGDTAETVPKFRKENPDVMCDVIHIDAGHSFEAVLADIKNMKAFAKEDTIVFLDDFDNWAIEKALTETEDIFEIDSKYVEHGQTEKGVDWLILSIWNRKFSKLSKFNKKTFVVGHYKL